MVSNLEKFLYCTTPVVPSQTLPKRDIRNLNQLWHPWERETVEYFTLGDLWSCYDEWSAYGAGVPILLNNGETVIQYYVPYLSALQIFTSNDSVENFREDVVDVGDYEIRDLFSDSCSDESESSGMHIYARPSTTTTTTIGLGFRVLPFLLAALWIHAMGCSLLVSLASLICLIFLPVLCFKGKPSKAIVDSLAAFGAGAMLGDAFLHQLPHAFGGKHSHSHHHGDLHDSGHSHSHSHSLEDLSIGLSILSGIVLFLLVEKVVRYVEDHSGKEKGAWGHSHHHHSHKRSNKVKVDDDAPDNLGSSSSDVKGGKKLQLPSESETPDGVSDGCFNDQEPNGKNVLLRKRVTTNSAGVEDKPDSEPKKAGTGKTSHLSERSPDPSSSNLVFGYLNLFSDGVHNFTDGMALGSAFILHGSVGGWSRTLFLLAHELPQEVGDFGILVRSGFSVSKALFFNFLSALVALAGTALALLLGQDAGQSSLIEGFTAGGFIYISVAGVLPELSNGKSSIRSTLVQATSLVLGMAVALCISLVE